MTVLRDPLLSCVRLADALAETAADANRDSRLDRRRDAVGALYAAHGAGIHRFLCDLLGDAALAADATQETFVRAFRRIDSLDDRGTTVDGRARAWLFGVARNVSLEVRRARFRAGHVFDRDASDRVDAAAAPGSPEATLLGEESARVVSGALDALGEDRRAALLLRLDHGLAYEDIAATMGWTLAKVKVEIHRAREALRAALAAYEGGAR